MMDGNSWILIGAVATVIAAVSIPYGFYLKSQEAKPAMSPVSISGDFIQGDKITSSGNHSIPVIEVSIDSQKILRFINKGLHDLEDIEIYVTEYWLKGESFLKEVEIADFQQIRQPIHKQALLKINDKIALDLSQKPLLKFYENPGGKGDDEPVLKNYALRITMRSNVSKQKYVHYELTSAVKNFALFADSYGTIRSGKYSDFITELPNVLKTHQRKLFGDKNLKEI